MRSEAHEHRVANDYLFRDPPPQSFQINQLSVCLLFIFIIFLKKFRKIATFGISYFGGFFFYTTVGRFEKLMRLGHHYAGANVGTTNFAQKILTLF